MVGVISHGAKDGYVGLFSSILKFFLESFVSVFQASSSGLSCRTGMVLLNSPDQKLSSRNLQRESPLLHAFRSEKMLRLRLYNVFCELTVPRL